MSIRDDFAAYSIRGLVSGNRSPGVVSGNALLFSAEKLFVLEQNGELTYQDKLDFINAVKEECEVRPGLYRRSRDFNSDQEGPDDYVGLTAASALIGSDIASSVLEYGKSHSFPGLPSWVDYYYCNVPNPTTNERFEAYLGRQPQLIAHFQYCNKERPALWRRLWWAVTVATTGMFSKGLPSAPGNQDAYILSWLLIKGFTLSGQKSWLCSLASKLFAHKLKKQWGSMKNVFACYFQNPDHPIAKWIKE